MTVDHSSYLRRGAIALAAVAVGGYLVDYVFNLGLTRFLSPHDYGDFKVAYAFGFFFGLALLLGGDRAAPRVLAPLIAQGEARGTWEYLRFYLRTATVLGLGLIALTWGLAALHARSPHPGDHHPLAWAAFAVPLNAAAALVSRTLQSARRPALAAVPWRLGLPLLQLFLFLGLVALRGALTLVEAILISIASTAVIAVWQWRRVVGLGLVETAPDPDSRSPQAWLAMSLPMMGAFLVALALNQSDLYFLELLGDEAEVGHYAAASTVAHVVTVIQVTLVSLVAPLAGPALEDGADSSRATFRRGISWMVGMALPLSLLLVFLGEPVLALFGAQYRVGHGVLQLLVVGNLGWALAALSALWLQYRGRAKVVLVVSVAALVVDSALNLLLIPRFGMVGAAAGTAATLLGGAVAVVAAHVRAPRPQAAARVALG